MFVFYLNLVTKVALNIINIICLNCFNLNYQWLLYSAICPSTLNISEDNRSINPENYRVQLFGIYFKGRFKRSKSPIIIRRYNGTVVIGAIYYIIHYFIVVGIMS